MSRLRTVALLGRPAGLRVLEQCLLFHPCIDLACVFTHALRPQAEGGGRRSEFGRYAAVCSAAGVRLNALDYPQARQLEEHLPSENLDLLVTLSWRFLVSDKALSRFRLGGINLHRGDLPQYAGAEPVRRAFENGESRLAITAHRMTSVIDAGPALAKVWVDVDSSQTSLPISEKIDTAKARLEGLYPALMDLAIRATIT